MAAAAAARNALVRRVNGMLSPFLLVLNTGEHDTIFTRYKAVIAPGFNALL